MKKYSTITALLLISILLSACSTNQSGFEEGEISDEAQQEIQDLIDADQEKLNAESQFEEGEISEKEQQEIQNLIDAAEEKYGE